MKIAILGRGISLKEYFKYSHLFKKIYIVGRFYKEIKKIGISFFEDKEIIHVVSRTDRALRNNYYEKLNIPYIQTACHDLKKQFRNSKGKDLCKKFPKNIKLKEVPVYMRERGYPPLSGGDIINFIKKFNNYKELCVFLENKFPKKIKTIGRLTRRSRYWPTAGAFCIDLVLNENKLKELYFFGIDNYTTLTYSFYKDMEFSDVYENSGTKMAFYHIKEMIKEFPKVQFYSTAKSKKFKWDLHNWNMI